MRVRMASRVGARAARSILACAILLAPARATAAPDSEPTGPQIVVDLDLGEGGSDGVAAMREALTDATELALARRRDELGDDMPSRVYVSVLMQDADKGGGFYGLVRLTHADTRKVARRSIDCSDCGASAMVERIGADVEQGLLDLQGTLAASRAAPPARPAATPDAAAKTLPLPPQKWRPSALGISGLVVGSAGAVGLAVSAGLFAHNRREPAPGDRATSVRNGTIIGMSISAAYVAVGVGLLGADVALARRDRRRSTTVTPLVGREVVGVSVARRF